MSVELLDLDSLTNKVERSLGYIKESLPGSQRQAQGYHTMLPFISICSMGDSNDVGTIISASTPGLA